MKNWKTTVCGLVIAAATAVQTYNGHAGWHGYVTAAAIAVFGVLVKDFNA